MITDLNNNWVRNSGIVIFFVANKLRRIGGSRGGALHGLGRGRSRETGHGRQNEVCFPV